MKTAHGPVAMFDSGLGGLTVLSALRALVPSVDVVYLADTAHVPYGDRTLEDIAQLAAGNIKRLQEYDPAIILIACGSSCSAFDARGWPDTQVPLVGLVEHGARAAVAASRSGRIGVIATQATAKSGVFGRAIRRLRPDAMPVELGAPALVPIVEAGDSSTERAAIAVAQACEPIKAGVCDALILGCTHFPHLSAWFAQALGPQVALVDPAQACARECAEMLEGAPPGQGRLIVEVTGDTHSFARHAAALGAPAITQLVSYAGLRSGPK
ncbi:MAG TPA: glutamate racemase [Candidatus Tumulicola sp.]|nr:glutamate racemase [Candidatus Tumulicola sp.]